MLSRIIQEQMANPSQAELNAESQNSADTDDVPDPTVTLHLHIDEPEPPLTGWLDRHLQSIATNAGIDGQVNIGVVNDDEMARLHKQFRNVEGTTDVLTFELGDQTYEESGRVDGEIIVCIDEAARQASARGHEIRVELLLYVVHGLLHLIGYDDVTEKGAAQMHQREDELLNEAGFGSVFYKPND